MFPKAPLNENEKKLKEKMETTVSSSNAFTTRYFASKEQEQAYPFVFTDDIIDKCDEDFAVVELNGFKKQQLKRRLEHETILYPEEQKKLDLLCEQAPKKVKFSKVYDCTATFESLTLQVAALSAQVSALQTDNTNLTQQVATLTAQVSALQTITNNLTQRVTTLETNNAGLTKQVEEVKIIL